MYCTFILQSKLMKTKILKDRQTLLGGREKKGGNFPLLAPRWLRAWLNSILQIFQSNLCLISLKVLQRDQKLGRQ